MVLATTDTFSSHIVLQLNKLMHSDCSVFIVNTIHVAAILSGYELLTFRTVSWCRFVSHSNIHIEYRGNTFKQLILSLIIP